jgi:hypothetical protein
VWASASTCLASSTSSSTGSMTAQYVPSGRWGCHSISTFVRCVPCVGLCSVHDCRVSLMLSVGCSGQFRGLGKRPCRTVQECLCRTGGVVGWPLFVHGPDSGLTGTQAVPHTFDTFDQQTVAADSQGRWLVLTACLRSCCHCVLVSTSHSILCGSGTHPFADPDFWDGWCRRVCQCGASVSLKIQRA